jgi:hypothetical protein
MKKFIFYLSLVALLGLVAPGCCKSISFDPFPGIPPEVTVKYFDGGLTGPLLTLPTPNNQPLVLSPTPSAVDRSNALLTYYLEPPFQDDPFGPYGVLFIFDTPQTFVSMVGNDRSGEEGDNEVVYLSAFNSAGAFIGNSTGTGPSVGSFVDDLKPVSFSGNDIKYIAFTWTTDNGYYSLDNVKYSCVRIVPSR